MKVVEFMLQENDPDFVLSTVGRPRNQIRPLHVLVGLIVVFLSALSLSSDTAGRIPILLLAGAAIFSIACNMLIVKFGVDNVAEGTPRSLFWWIIPGNQSVFASHVEFERSLAVMRPILEKRGRVAVIISTDGLEIEFDAKKTKFPRSEFGEVKADSHIILFESKSGLKAFIPRRAVGSSKEWAELSELVTGKRAA